MPDHWHGLLEGSSAEADFCAFMKCFRQRATLACAAARVRPLWQSGYFERVLRAEEATPVIATYILANPVRAGLVDRPEAYPYSWSAYGSGDWPN